MIELFITSKDFFSVYFSDLNVPTAYIILTVAIFLICWHKKIPLIRTFFIWIFSGFGVATLLDAVYDYQIKLFVLHNMSLGEGLLFLVFPIPVYALSFLIWRYGEKKRLLFLVVPIIYELAATGLNISSHLNIDYSASVRYCYVLWFLNIIIGLKVKK